MSTLTNRIDAAHDAIDKALLFGLPAKPVLLCSFGKDSMVMVDLLTQHGVYDVLHLEDLDEYVDRDFNRNVVDRYQLRVTKLPRGRGVFYTIAGEPFFLAFPHITPHVMLPVPTNITRHTDERNFTCLDEKLAATRGPIQPESFDTFFTGQKMQDFDLGKCATFANRLPVGMLIDFRRSLAAQGEHYEISDLPFCSPLFGWSDADVWAYTRAQNIPWSAKIYTETGERLPYPHVVCTRCHEPGEDSRVPCPRMGDQLITNFAALARDDGLDRLVGLGVMGANVRDALRVKGPRAEAPGPTTDRGESPSDTETVAGGLA